MILRLFGSTVNGFGSKISDLDISMNFQSIGFNYGMDNTQALSTLARHLHRHPNLTKIVPIRTAKVPVVKFFDKTLGIEGNIVLRNFLGIRNSQLLRTYASIDQRVKILGYTLKYLAKVSQSLYLEKN